MIRPATPRLRGIGGLTCCGSLDCMRQTKSRSAAPGICQSPQLLPEEQVIRRLALLAELRDALSAQGIGSVVARNHRIVLRFNASPYEPSGLTNPGLHILGGERIEAVTTDGAAYHLPGNRQCSVSDPAGAALMIAQAADDCH